MFALTNNHYVDAYLEGVCPGSSTNHFLQHLVNKRGLRALLDLPRMSFGELHPEGLDERKVDLKGHPAVIAFSQSGALHIYLDVEVTRTNIRGGQKVNERFVESLGQILRDAPYIFHTSREPLNRSEKEPESALAAYNSTDWDFYKGIFDTLKTLLDGGTVTINDGRVDEIDTITLVKEQAPLVESHA